MLEYRRRREAIYRPLREAGIFTWDSLYGAEYALASLHFLPGGLCREIRAATEGLGKIFARTTTIVQQGKNRLLRELGIPAAAIPAVRLRVFPDLPAAIGRFDFALTDAGLKMLEYNAETPCSIVEAFYVNRQVCRFFGAEDPNPGVSGHIPAVFRRTVDRYLALGYPVEHVYFSSVDWHEEDLGNTRYLLLQSGLKAAYTPLSQLRIQDHRLYVRQEEQFLPVDVLYRLYPLEKLAEDRDEDGYPTGAHLLELIADRRLAVINPPAALIAQTKALQALIWNLYETGAFFDSEERDLIRTYMLPTYLEDRFTGRRPFVTKPVYGREGGAVALYNSAGETEARDGETEYWDQPMVYQERVVTRQVEAETLIGMFRGYMILGSFLIGGRASAIGARLGGIITGDMAYYLPIGLKG